MRREFKVESDFEYQGIRCVVIFGEMGHRCGYVGVPKESILYGKSYSESLKCLVKKQVENEPIGKRGIVPIFCMDRENEFMSMDCYFDVHGGVTYADGGESSKYPVESDLWWVGFDCGHCQDLQDLGQALEYGLIDLKTKNRLDDCFGLMDGEIRTKEYCEQECRNLVNQIKKVDL